VIQGAEGDAHPSTKECIVIEFEKFLAPWEHDGEGKPLAEPAEIDPAKLKKFVYDVLSDKEKAQDDKADVETTLAQKEEALTTMQREKETDAERVARENTERDQRYARLEAESVERRKVEFLQEHFADQKIELGRARRLAGKISGDTEQAWADAAKAEVEDGFRLTTATTEVVEPVVETDLLGRPRVVRSDGTPAIVVTDKPKTIAEQVDELIPVSTW